MQLVKLYTSTGGFVVAGYVPPFGEHFEADVILWGTRVFKLNRSGGNAVADGDGALLYTEAFAVALVSLDDRTF